MLILGQWTKSNMWISAYCDIAEPVLDLLNLFQQNTENLIWKTKRTRDNCVKEY